MKHKRSIQSWKPGAILKIAALVLIVLVVAYKFIPLVTKPKVHLDFFQPDCMAACWNGLKPGISTERATAAFFEKSFEWRKTFTTDGFNFFSGAVGNRNYGVEAYTKDDILTGMTIGTPHLFDLSLGQIVDTLGQPPYHMALAGKDGPEFPIEFSYAVLYYPQAGYVFRLDAEPDVMKSDFCFKRETYTERINVVASGDIRQVIRDADYALFPQMDDDSIAKFASGLDETPLQFCN